MQRLVLKKECNFNNCLSMNQNFLALLAFLFYISGMVQARS